MTDFEIQSSHKAEEGFKEETPLKKYINMGGAVAVPVVSPREKPDLDDVKTSKIMMPVYYLPGEIPEEELKLVLECWGAVVEGIAPSFVEMNETGIIKFATGEEWFIDVFFKRLAFVDSVKFSSFFQVTFFVVMFVCCCCFSQFSAHLFVDPVERVSFFKHFFCLLYMSPSSASNAEAFSPTLEALAISMRRKEFKFVEYGLAGESLFWTVNHCLVDILTRKTKTAWVKFVNTILTVIVPMAEELDKQCIQQPLVSLTNM